MAWDGHRIYKLCGEVARAGGVRHALRAKKGKYLTPWQSEKSCYITMRGLRSLLRMQHLPLQLRIISTMRSLNTTNKSRRLDTIRIVYRFYAVTQKIIQTAIIHSAHGWARAIIPRRGVRDGGKLSGIPGWQLNARPTRKNRGRLVIIYILHSTRIPNSYKRIGVGEK